MISPDSQAAQRTNDLGIDLWQPTDQKRYCRGFYLPAPALTIKANGEMATCGITNAGEGYGYIHPHDLIGILNHLSVACQSPVRRVSSVR